MERRMDGMTGGKVQWTDYFFLNCKKMSNMRNYKTELHLVFLEERENGDDGGKRMEKM